MVDDLSIAIVSSMVFRSSVAGIPASSSSSSSSVAVVAAITVTRQINHATCTRPWKVARVVVAAREITIVLTLLSAV